MVQKSKKTIREAIKRVRRKLPASYQQKTSKTVCQSIGRMEVYRRAKHLGLYMSANGEIDLKALWEIAPRHGKFCYFPLLNEDKTLSFLPATPRSHFIKNQFGILEPDVDKSHAIAPADLDLVMLPLVGFDSRGNRLGMGAGYYDRTFEHVKGPFMLGIAYEFQHQVHIPSQDWDVPLNGVITETKLYESQL